MKKTIKISLLVYGFIVLLSCIYCKPSLKLVIEMLFMTTIITSFNYLVMLLEKLTINSESHRYLMKITGGLIKYVPFLMTVGFILFACQSIFQLIRTKNFMFVSSFLPILGSIHVNSMILKTYSSNK